MNIEKFKFNIDECSVAEWVTQFAAVSRGKNKSNDPEKRLKALMKEGAGKQPSRPLELMPVMVHTNNLTEEQKNELFKFGHLEDNVFHTNLRAVIKAGVNENNYAPSNKPFFVYRLSVKKKVWCNLVIKPIATIISNSARMIALKDNNVCAEEVSVIIGGYEKDINVQMIVYKEIADMNPDIEISSTMESIVAYISGNASNNEKCLNYLDFDYFTCNDGKGPFYMADPNEKYCQIIEDKDRDFPITYNECRLINNGKNIPVKDCVKVYMKLPLFVLYHLYTHTELEVSNARITNEIWFPKEMPNEDKLKVIEFIDRKDYSLTREYMKSLGYKKEIYNRYPEFALMTYVTIIGRKGNKNGILHLLKERNVIDSSSSNWTQKETTEYLKLMIDTARKRELILQ